MGLAFKGRVFSVEVDTARFPNGTEHEVAIVRHAPSVVVIPIDGEGRVILIRQYRAPLSLELWELPAGSIEPGESADTAAKRECEEEIGLVPAVIEHLKALYPTPGYCDEQMIFYRASSLERPDPDSRHKPDEDEDIHPQAFTIGEAKRMVDSGEIVDLKTAYGLTLIARL